MKVVMNKKFDLETYGDPIERENIDFITNKINSYRCIWEFFIGNNNGYPPTTNGLTAQQSLNRTKLAENNYSILLSLLSIKRKLDHYLIEKHKQSDSFEINENIKLIFSSISSIIDLLEKNLALVNIYDQKLKDKISLVDKYMEERNEALHGRKLRIKIDSGVVYIPKTELKENSFLNDKKWIEYNDNEFIELYVYLDKCLDFLCEVSSDTFSKIFDKLLKDWKNIGFVGVDYNNIDTTQYSGTTETNITIIK
jgi:hypothetical protein